MLRWYDVECASIVRFIGAGVSKTFHCTPQMPEESPSRPPAAGATSSPRLSLRRWFVIGFVLVFVGMLLLINRFFYTGDALVQCKLWEFYFFEVQRVFTSSGNLGPTSGSGTRAFIVFFAHLVVSVVAGALAMGFGAIVRFARQ